MLKVVGYPDRWSVAPGEDITFHLSVEEDGETAVEARLVKVICGDCNPAGPGLKLPVVKAVKPVKAKARRQRIDAGSYMVAPEVPALEGAWTLLVTVWPTRPAGGGDQVIAAQWDAEKKSGFRLLLDNDGHLALEYSQRPGSFQRVRIDRPLLERRWTRIVLIHEADSRRFRLRTAPYEAAAKPAMLVVNDAEFVSAAGGMTIAGCEERKGGLGDHFDGKIEHPIVLRNMHAFASYDSLLLDRGAAREAADLIVWWDFTREIETTRVVDVGPNRCHGTLVNLPTRAMIGSNWTGEWHDWRQRPEHYGAIHFHHDDVYDAGWQPTCKITIPDDLPSGAYALHATCGPSDDTVTRETYIPFFVRPPRDPAVRKKRKNAPKVAFLAPTCAYMAYANHAEHITAREAERVVGRLLEFGHTDLYMYDHPELGGSLYDSHLDGSGVSITSRLRPVLNFSSRYHSWLGGAGSALWQYNADTHIFDWLDQQQIDYDVITDEDLHEDGYRLLKDYRVVLTGTHPEYHSTEMWDAMKAWQDHGGRLMYLGANGWYWRVAFHKELPGVIEVRRAEDGIRTWAADPGEYHHSFNGELGGLWRRIGRPPNVMVGVGFMAQGFDVCSYYRRAPDADNPRAAFIFDGVPDEKIGDFGLIGGGAAGLELDAITYRLGSPPNTLRLATSEGHSALVALVNEEFGVVPPNLGGDQNDRVRGDLAFYETPSGGAVFSVSSIAWAGSLSWNGYDNNVSKITGNVLRRFMDEKPFKLP